MIYTSYYGNLRNLPDTVVPVAVSGGIPKFFKGLSCRELNPKYNSFKKFKEDGDSETFSKAYKELVLSKLNVSEMVQKLYKLSGGFDVCLVCYEKSDSFCHRHLISEWLVENGYACKEYMKPLGIDNK